MSDAGRKKVKFDSRDWVRLNSIECGVSRQTKVKQIDVLCRYIRHKREFVEEMKESDHQFTKDCLKGLMRMSHNVWKLRKGIKLMISQCRARYSKDTCRAVIKTGKELLKKGEDGHSE